MANFDRSGMTQAGINLMGKAVGGATIQFTKLVLGDGTMTGEILDLQGVVSPKQNVDVTRIERNDNQCTVGGELLTRYVKQGFFWREAGLYAMDPDQGEILYNYAYSTKPDYIAASDSGMMEEILVSMVATVGSNTNVDVTIDSSMVFSTKKEYTHLKNNVEHISIHVDDFGAVGDGITDDTLAIQNAMDYASKYNATVLMGIKKTYIVRSLVPKQKCTIDLNGSTLKLKDNTNLPIFYDAISQTRYSGFSVINGKLDGNQQFNNLVNQSAGIVWCGNAEGMVFKDLEVINAFRNVFNFYGVSNVTISDIYIHDCGTENEKGFYSYGISFEDVCADIVINNVRIKNLYGYGMHFRKCTNVVINNTSIIKLARKGYGIGITLTESTNISLTNTNISDIDHLGIECNCSSYVDINNVVIDKTTTPFVFGDNGQSLFSYMVSIRNLKTTNTFGNYAFNLNWIKQLSVYDFMVDKGITTTYDISSEKLIFTNGSIVGNAHVNMFMPRFELYNCKFTDVYVKRSSDKNRQLRLSSLSIPTGESASVSLGAFSQYENYGTLTVRSQMHGNGRQGTIQMLLFFKHTDVLNISTIGEVSGDYARKCSISVKDKNTLTLTNNTDVTLLVDVDCN